MDVCIYVNGSSRVPARLRHCVQPFSGAHFEFGFYIVIFIGCVDRCGPMQTLSLILRVCKICNFLIFVHGSSFNFFFKFVDFINLTSC